MMVKLSASKNFVMPQSRKHRCDTSRYLAAGGAGGQSYNSGCGLEATSEDYQRQYQALYKRAKKAMKLKAQTVRSFHVVHRPLTGA